MKNVLVILFFCVEVVNYTAAQVIDVTQLQKIDRLPITPYASILRTSKIIPIDSVAYNQVGFTRAENEPVLIYSYDPYYYCFRFIIKNHRPFPQQIMLLMAPVGIRDATLYQKSKNKWHSVAHTGLKYNFEDRTYQFTHHVFPFSISANKIDTIYLQTDATNVFKSFGFALLPPKALKIFENRIYFIFGIIEGLLILFFFLNVSLFFALKERLHLWYALYISLLFWIVMKNDHLEQQFLGMDSEFHYRILPYMSVGALAIGVLMHVVHSFFSKELSLCKPLLRASLLCKIIVLISALVHFMAFNFNSNYVDLNMAYSFSRFSTLFGMIMIMIVCMYSFKKGNKGGLFIFSGTAIFMIGSAQRLFFPSTLSFLFPPTTFHIGIVVETLIISLGLIWRFWNEKETHRRREKEIQTQTMHEISQEIHDNVGQTLTLAKYNLYGMSLLEQHGNEKIVDTANLIGKALSDLRDLSRNLKAEQVQKQSITYHIKIELEQVAKTGAFKTKFEVQGEGYEIEQKTASNILRIIKEIFQNILKHSHASLVSVSIRYNDNGMEIVVCDNGIGFQMEEVLEQSNGLQNIENRCKALKANYNIETANDAGTTITFIIPINRTLDAEKHFKVNKTIDLRHSATINKK